MKQYRLESSDGTNREIRWFYSYEYNDAVTRAAGRIVELDAQESAWAAYVSLIKVGIMGAPTYLIGWTKTSNERPTAEGELSDTQPLN